MYGCFFFFFFLEIKRMKTVDIASQIFLFTTKFLAFIKVKTEVYHLL